MITETELEKLTMDQLVNLEAQLYERIRSKQANVVDAQDYLAVVRRITELEIQ